MGKPQPGEALRGREVPDPERVLQLFLFARVEWRSLLRVRDPESRGRYVLTGLRVMAYVHGFELFEDELAVVRRALASRATQKRPQK